MVKKFGMDKTTSEQVLAQKFDAVDHKVKQRIREEYVIHGFIRDKKKF